MKYIKIVICWESKEEEEEITQIVENLTGTCIKMHLSMFILHIATPISTESNWSQPEFSGLWSIQCPIRFRLKPKIRRQTKVFFNLQSKIRSKTQRNVQKCIENSNAQNSFKIKQKSFRASNSKPNNCN